MSSTEITSIVQMQPETDRQIVEPIPEGMKEFRIYEWKIGLCRRGTIDYQ